MLRKLIWALILLPLAVAFIALAVANRHIVRLVLDPLSPQSPALAVDAPFFLFVALALAAGVLIGGIAAWLGQGKWRRTARRRSREAAHLHRETERLSAQLQAAARPRLPTPAIE